MSKTKTDPNAPAMPGKSGQWHPGLTKREWFAGLAMQGLCANAQFLKSCERQGDLEGTPPTLPAARSARTFADALIAALNEEASHGE